MRLQYRMSERNDGDRVFIVNASVILDEAEARLISAYPVLDRIEVGRKFTEVKGVDTQGDVRLDQFVGRNVELKFPTIQMATDFVASLRKGLETVKKQLAVTRESVAALEKNIDVEI